jgi:hypothetical protein
MNAYKNGLSLVILLALATFPILIPSTSAISAPTVPQFSVKFTPSSYSVTTTDPYTGQTTTTLNHNNTIQVTIKNQPAIDSTHQIYYNIRVRPHFEGNWTELFPLWNLASAPARSEAGDFPMAQYLYHADLPLARRTPMQSNGEYTTITFALNENNEYTPDALIDLPDNARVDFQVEAIVGHDAQYWYIQHPLFPTYGGLYQDSVAYDTDSGWSSTQTITVGTDSAAAAITDLLGSRQVSIWIVVVVSAIIVVAVIAVAAVLIKRAKTQTATASSK